MCRFTRPQQRGPVFFSRAFQLMPETLDRYSIHSKGKEKLPKSGLTLFLFTDAATNMLTGLKPQFYGKGKKI
jgi:hypothetical protein